MAVAVGAGANDRARGELAHERDEARKRRRERTVRARRPARVRPTRTPVWADP